MKIRVVQSLFLDAILCPAPLLVANERVINSDSPAGANVRYREQSRLEHLPLPVLSFPPPGLASGSREIADIQDNLVVPLIRESAKPASAIVVEFFPNRPTAIGALVLRPDGEVREPLLHGSRQARALKNSYSARVPS